MKKFILTILLFEFIIACNNPQKGISLTAKVNKTTSSKPDSPPNKTASTPDKTTLKAELKIGTYFFDAIDTNSFAYIGNNDYCVVWGRLGTYQYYPITQVLLVTCPQTYSNQVDSFYYKIYCGYDTNNITVLSLRGNLLTSIWYRFDMQHDYENPCFSLVRMKQTGPNKLITANNEGGDWLNIYKPMNSRLVALINSFYSYKKKELYNLIQSIESTFTVIDSKVNSLKNLPKTTVDSLLKNKIDDNFNSLINQWESIAKKENRLETYASNASKIYSEQELSDTKTFTELAKNCFLGQQLKTDIDQYYKNLTEVVSPLLQQSNINL